MSAAASRRRGIPVPCGERRGTQEVCDVHYYRHGPHMCELLGNDAARIRMQDFTLLMPGKLMKGPVLKSRGKQKLSNKVKL